MVLVDLNDGGSPMWLSRLWCEGRTPSRTRSELWPSQTGVRLLGDKTDDAGTGVQSDQAAAVTASGGLHASVSESA